MLSKEKEDELKAEVFLSNIDKDLTEEELELFSFENIWNSILKCAKGVTWKLTTKKFLINAPTKALKMYKQILSGTWEDGEPNIILILYPKKRQGLANKYNDRVYQKILNDLCLYPRLSRSFIVGNSACQKGRGPDYARFMIEDYYRKYFINYGTDFCIIKTDIEGYYPNMNHDFIKSIFKRKTSVAIGNRVCTVLDKQKTKNDNSNKGYYPGSQLLQIAGIAALNDMEHKLKEIKHVKGLVRYQDDIIIFCTSKHEAKELLDFIQSELHKYKFKLKSKKTFILNSTDNFKFLGFKYKLSETGKLKKYILSRTVNHEKLKLKRMITKLSKDNTPENFSKIQDCFDSFCEHLRYGDTKILCISIVKELNELLKNLGISKMLIFTYKGKKKRNNRKLRIPKIYY